MVARTGRSIPLALAFLAIASMPSLVRAQGNTFNPYGNSGYSDYREFGNPSYSGNTTLPGQSRIDDEPLVTRPRANSFRQYLQETEVDPVGNRRSSAGAANRVYKPNDNAQNSAFLERMKQRDLAFAKAMQEKDPVKRSKLLRQIENDSLERTPTTKSKTAIAGKAPEPNSASRGATSRAPSPTTSSAPSLSSNRRSSAPPPPPINGTRRASGSTKPPAPPLNGATAPKPGGTSTTTAPAAPDPSTIAVPPPR
jgi:hypothetical protein